MITINVFPASQAFPRPPDGGKIVPNTIDVTAVVKQGFPLAPNLLFNFSGPAATPPLNPFLPGAVAAPTVPVLFSMIPDAANYPVNINKDRDVLAEQVDAPPSARDIVITDAGSFEVNPAETLQTYVVATVVDNETGGAPDVNTVNFRLTLVGGALLNSYFITLTGRSLLFTAGAWIIPAGTVPERPILAWGVTQAGANVIVVPKASAPDSSGAVTPVAPVPGNKVAFDSARRSSEVVFQNLGIVSNNQPETFPLLPTPPLEDFYSIPDVFVPNQNPVYPNPEDVFEPRNPVTLVEMIPGSIPFIKVIEEPPFPSLPENVPPLSTPTASTKPASNAFVRVIDETSEIGVPPNIIIP
jgi:hypothetical protein